METIQSVSFLSFNRKFYCIPIDIDIHIIKSDITIIFHIDSKTHVCSQT